MTRRDDRLHTQRHTLPIAEVSARMRVRIIGTIVALTYRGAGRHPRLVAVLSDGTGRLNLVFMGRRTIGGFTPGRNLVASGTVMHGSDGLQMMNPAYQLLPDKVIT
ncbi:MAG: OB-fold nucleic acid binding domain-containing protein [Bowdeniella nasicola]|nr:OB-fold nucleic acid binding domain-containing protein [Bowdeniella nasicola]